MDGLTGVIEVSHEHGLNLVQACSNDGWQFRREHFFLSAGMNRNAKLRIGHIPERLDGYVSAELGEGNLLLVIDEK